MAKDVYESHMMVLYERMKAMQKDFESKKQDLDGFNKLYDEHAEQLKVSSRASEVRATVKKGQNSISRKEERFFRNATR